MSAQSQMRDPPNLELLIKLMKMTTSATDGEALAAIRMANRQLAISGGDWEDLLRGKLATIDPFASLPEPPKAAPKPAPQPHSFTAGHGTGYQTAPKPIYYGLIAKEAKDITSWLVACEFASLDPQLTRQINHIDMRWQANKKLDSADYTTLKTTAASVKRRRP